MLSIVVPVYNSAAVVAQTIDRLIAVCERQTWTYEIIAVDDASRDRSLEILRDQASQHPTLRVVAHALNAGQHAALLTGLRAAGGEFVVTMDDDLQHPPEAVPALVAMAREGHDVVCARFTVVRHPMWRRPGSLVLRWIDRQVFGAPVGLVVTSFRVLHRTVVDRICAYRGPAPYIRGQMLLGARRPANLDVAHAPRDGATSSYSATALAGFVARVLIEWSHVPAWMAIAAGLLWLGAAAVALRVEAGALFGPVFLLYGLTLVICGVVGLRRPLPQHTQARGTEPPGDLPDDRG